MSDAMDILARLRRADPLSMQRTCGSALLGDAADEIERLRAALDGLVNAKALSGVRDIVAGWNGEGKSDGPYPRHPNGLGATLPKTNCGAVYALDEAMQNARAILCGNEQTAQTKGEGE